VFSNATSAEQALLRRSEVPTVHNGQRKTVLTTGDVAKICCVAPRTVSKWFDSGQLRGYRIPGSKDRRIPLDQLVKFMRAHGIPLNGIDAGVTRVLVLDGDGGVREALRASLEQSDTFEVFLAETALEAGAVAQDCEPHVAVIDISLSDVEPKSVVRFFRSAAELSHARLIGTGMGLTDGAGEALLQAGFDAYLAKPFETQALISLIEHHTPTVISS